MNVCKKASRARTCSIDGCQGTHKAQGYCDLHYQRWKKYGDPRVEIPIRSEIVNNLPPCFVEGCDAISTSLRSGICDAHYKRRWRHGDVSSNTPRKRNYEPGATCEYRACHEPVQSKGFCELHYTRDRRGFDMDATKMPRYSDEDVCEDISCGRRPVARGLCFYHYTAKRSWRQLPRKLVEARIAYYGGKCWICGDPYEHMDHVKPLARGGAHLVSNLRPACARCNQKKNAMWPFDVSAFRERLAAA